MRKESKTLVSLTTTLLESTFSTSFLEKRGGEWLLSPRPVLSRHGLCRARSIGDFMPVLRSASQVLAHRAAVRSSQDRWAISPLEMLPRSERPHRQARPHVTTALAGC